MIANVNNQVSRSGVSFFGMSESDLDSLIGELGEPSYRAGQVQRWVYERGATTFDQMSDLPAKLRGRLAESIRLYRGTIVKESHSTDGVCKQLLRWPDGSTTECVLIPDGERRTACISTQVGCPVGCVFCASGLDGLSRHLDAGEIVEQAMQVRRLCGDDRLSNVVFMGLGEPLHNYDATMAAVRTLNSPKGMNIGARKITISTVGLPKQIKRLAAEGIQLTLAISLHAPNDALRGQLIPWAESISIDALIDAGKTYFERTGREVTLEYVLLGGVNDQKTHAVELATVAKRMRSNINLIRFHPVDGLPYKRPTSESAARFQSALRSRGINCHVRKSRGMDVEAACGQLRRRHQSAGGLTMISNKNVEAIH